MTRVIVKNTGKDPVEITIEVNGKPQKTIVNKGRIELPEGAKLLSSHPNIKTNEKAKAKEPEPVVVKNKTYDKNQKVS